MTPGQLQTLIAVHNRRADPKARQAEPEYDDPSALIGLAAMRIGA